MMSNGERATQHSLAGNHAADGNLEVAERRMAIESLANDWKDGETSEAVTRDRRGRLHVSGHTLSPTRKVEDMHVRPTLRVCPNLGPRSARRRPRVPS